MERYKIRVAVVHNFYRSSSPSGENTAVEAQIAALRKRGHDVALFSTSSDELDDSLWARVSLARDVAAGGSKGRELSEQINSYRPSVIHVHNTFPRPGSKWVRDVDAPIVATLHNFRPLCASGLLTRNNVECTLCPDNSSINSLVHKCYRDSFLATLPLSISTRNSGASNLLLNHADHLIALSDYSKAMYDRNVNGSSVISVIPNFSPLKAERTKMRLNSRMWVYVGRLSDEKGILELVNNWPDSRSLTIYGSGELEEVIKRLIFGRANIRYSGNIHRNDLEHVLNNSMGLVFPSICRENAPMIYVEALSAGLPVVAFSANTVSESVKADVTGAIFSNWDEIDAALQEVELNRTLYSENGIRLALNRYSEDAWYEAILNAYTAAIESKKPGCEGD